MATLGTSLLRYWGVTWPRSTAASGWWAWATWGAGWSAWRCPASPASTPAAPGPCSLPGWQFNRNIFGVIFLFDSVTFLNYPFLNCVESQAKTQMVLKLKLKPNNFLWNYHQGARGCPAGPHLAGHLQPGRQVDARWREAHSDGLHIIRWERGGVSGDSSALSVLPIGMHSSCSISPPANGTCTKYHDWVDDAHCIYVPMWQNSLHKTRNCLF